MDSSPADLLNLLAQSPAAATLLVLIVVPSLIGLFKRPDLIERNLFRPHWLVPRREYRTLVTSAFLHADLAHLFFNGFTFWAFAFPLERAIGTPRFLLLYGVGLAASDAATWFKHRDNPAYRCLGASGAIGAVLFAAILYFPAMSLFILPIPVPIPALLFALGYLAYSAWASRQARGRINHDAHLAGALAGLGFVVLVDPQVALRAVQYWLG
jgi:membrane associated rhomboid family serine protease